MIDNFVPLATYSGLPHLSNEQRDHFNKQKIKNMSAISPFFDNEMEDFVRVFFTDLLMGASPPTDWVSISLCANRFFMILSG